MAFRLQLLLLIFSCIRLPAQSGPQLRLPESYSSRVFGEEQGLSQHFVFSMTQDRNGELHLATEKGLVSFNGDQFITRTTRDGLPEDEVSCVFTDRSDRTWTGGFHKGIGYSSRGKITVTDTSVRAKVTAFAEAPDGMIWGCSNGAGAFRVRFSQPPVFPEGGRAVSGPMAFDSTGQLAAGCAYGLGIYHTGAGSSLTLSYTLPETQGKQVTALCIGKMYGRETLFVGVDGEGVLCYQLAGGTYILRLQLRAELGFSEPTISAIACDRNNVLWLGSMGEGLRRVSLDRSPMPLLVENYRGLPDENIKSLLVDSENNLWIGTFGHGLVQLPYSAFRFYTLQNGLLRPGVRCIAEDREGTLWLGHADGISCFRKDGKKPPQFFDASNGFASVAVNALAADSAGMIWIGTTGGIFRLDPSTKRFEDISRRYALDSKNINTISINRDGRVFFGTTDGLYIYNDSTAEFSYLTTMDGLMHNNIQQLYSDAENNTWFSSAGTPPYYLQKNQITAFGQIDKLRGYNINGICQDRDKTYWIATDGDGLFAYDGQAFRQYTPADGLRSSTCIAILTDTAGMIWTLHRNGVSVKFPGDTVFYPLNGMESTMLRNLNPTPYRDHREVLYFCTDNGLVEILPQDRSYLRRIPHLSLARFFVNGNEQNVDDHYSLGPGTYNLAFEFNSILFSVPTRPVFYYRLLGVDSAWQPVSGRNLIIPNLSSGRYTLQVSPLPQVQPGASFLQVTVFIDRPFWQKTWFRWTVVLSIPMIVVLLIRIQTLSLRRQNKRLEQLVAEKTSQLLDEKEAVSRMNAELESKNKDITDSIHYAERIQLAILPDLRILEEQFPESFIYLLPRDIVSGDFYWFAQKDGLFITAAIDCTGHGIPGAFMSMIGTTLLNKIVFDYNITGAAEILYHMNKEIIASLHQQSTPESSHDGMDIALCAFDREKKQVTFAGAGRPLYLVRAGELFAYKSAKAGLGNVYAPAEQRYEETEIPLQPGDMIYLFSDGYTDQFSAETGMKFSNRRMQELLRSIAHLGAEEQLEKVRQAFFRWKGDEIQFDDVLVMGVKI